MSYRRYMLFRLLGILVLAFLAAWATTTGNLLALIPVVIVLAVILFALRKRVKEIVVDERVNAIAYKATRLAYLAFVILAVITGAVLIILSKNGSPELFQIGLILDFSVCALLVFYWMAYIYYNRKLGGKE
jgi:uncharacterized membrane protein